MRPHLPFLLLPYIVLCHKSICTRRTLADPLSLQAPIPACVLPLQLHPSSDLPLPACTSNSCTPPTLSTSRFRSLPHGGMATAGDAWRHGNGDTARRARQSPRPYPIWQSSTLTLFSGSTPSSQPSSGEEPLSFSGRVSNSLSSLACPFPVVIHSHSVIRPERAAFHPPGSPPFAFSRATVTSQSKSTSTRESHSTGNVETTTASSSPSGGSPTEGTG